MKVMYVWESVSGLTQNYHDGGGALVIADNLEAARQLLKEKGVSEGSEVFVQEPDYTASVVTVLETQDRVFIFPDAGCC